MSVKLIDYKSKEKEIILEVFNEMPMMDNWIASIIESYIYGYIEDEIHDAWFGKINRKYKLKSGLYDGECEIFRNGELWRICNYKDGKLNGEFKEWFFGRLDYECYYKDDKLDGEYKRYSPETGLVSIRNFYKNGILEKSRRF